MWFQKWNLKSFFNFKSWIRFQFGSALAIIDPDYETYTLYDVAKWRMRSFHWELFHSHAPYGICIEFSSYWSLVNELPYIMYRLNNLTYNKMNMNSFCSKKANALHWKRFHDSTLLKLKWLVVITIPYSWTISSFQFTKV